MTTSEWIQCYCALFMGAELNLVQAWMRKKHLVCQSVLFQISETLKCPHYFTVYRFIILLLWLCTSAAHLITL